MAINEEKLRNSFEKIKNEINSILKDLKSYKNIIELQNNKILDLEMQLSKHNEQKNQKEGQNKDTIESSTGNKGVRHSFIHSFRHSLNKHSVTSNILNFKKDLDGLFISLPKQQFLTFLTIYQMEDDLKRPVSYDEVSEKLNLSSGCIRTYTSNLAKKGLPLTKLKVNNRTVLLSISQKFRELNVKSHLFSLYMKNNAEQTTFLDY